MSGRVQLRPLAAWLGAAALVTALAATPVSAKGNPAAAQGMGAATPSTIQACTSLVDFTFPSTVITSAVSVDAGTLTNRAQPIGEHCLVRGHMNERVSQVDGKTYRIGFEMRLPAAWSGRYLYQGNGGIDGAVSPATGAVGGGESGLQMGMAVLSSDAGHAGNQNPTFGLDPQARLDYGYQAVGTLTPMAKALIESAYGRPADRSYITGGSNGGRHTMVAAARYAEDYDGLLAVAPGFNLPQAAVAQIWGAQQWATVATGPDLNSALQPAEREVLADAILARCDRLDGLADGMVHASERCQKVFKIQRDVPTCTDARDGTCLTTEQKAVVAKVFDGARTSDDTAIYSSFPFDPGLTSPNWASWKFDAPLTRDSGAVGYIFSTPPDAPPLPTLPDYALDISIDHIASAIWTTGGPYTESSMEFMTPPEPYQLDTMRERGGKLLVVHGASDGVFSVDDTADWYEALDKASRNKAEAFARYFEVPGMNHVRGGPATDQHDALAALIDWVEAGTAPDRIPAWVNPANPDVPADWSKDRSRPLCLYPSIARYMGGDPESESSFRCTGDKPQPPSR